MKHMRGPDVVVGVEELERAGGEASPTPVASLLVLPPPVSRTRPRRGPVAHHAALTDGEDWACRFAGARAVGWTQAGPDQGVRSTSPVPELGITWGQRLPCGSEGRHHR